MITSENYREIYEDLVEETEDFTSESGVVKCTTKKASDIIREILSNYYNIIDYGISDIEDVDSNVYMVIYNDRNDEELSFDEEEPFDEPEEIEEVPDDIELPEDEDIVQESLSLIEGYLTEGIEESKSFVSEALKKHPELRELIKAGAWGELQEQVDKYYPPDEYYQTNDVKSESAWGKFLEVLDKSGVKYKIDSIPEYCFRNSDITSFRIPEGTTKIGSCSFERCYNLTSIEIPDSVTDIDFRAFWSCTSLTEIKLPASLEIIGPEAFRNCKNWKGDVVIPDTCHSIMGGAFMKCASLDSITIPKSVIHIGPDCFKECNLKSITLPTKYKYDIKELGLSGMPRKSIIITESLVEKIVKKGSKWQVQSEKGRNLGTYDTKEKAKKRLGQVEFFKQNESIDDNFKLHHSLKEDIPTFWEWVDDQGLDPDVVEENPDLEEYFRQQYDITFNLKSPEDYDLSDTDESDDDFQQEEEPLGYQFVCYYEDDDSPGEQNGSAETLEDAIKMCKGYIDKYNYDNAEIFGPNGDTAATFYEGEWNTDYNADINDMDLEEVEEINPNISLCKDNYTGKYYIVDNTNQEILGSGTTSLEKAKQMADDVKEYLSFDESLNETLSGLKSKKKLDILRELKKNPNYKEDPRWKQFEDELINFYRVDPSEADIDTAIYYTETDWIDAQHQMESLEEGYDKYEKYIKKAIIGAYGRKFYNAMVKARDYDDVWEAVELIDDEDIQDDIGNVVDWCQYKGQVPYYDVLGEIVNEFELDDNYTESLTEDSTGKIKFENREVIKLIKETANILNWTAYGVHFYSGGPTVDFCRPEGEIKSASEKRKVRQLFEDTFNGLTDDISIKVWSCVPLDVKKYNYPYPEGAFQISLKVTKYDRELSKDSHPLTDFEVHHLLGFRKPKESDYWDNKNESLTEEDELKFSPNYNPAGTPIGRGTGLGEEFDEEELSLECLNCGCDTEWLGTQGDLEEFKCPECGEYYYLTKDGRVVGEEAFRESLNSNKKLTEALIDRDMDTIKQSDLSKAPIGSVLRLKFNERPTNTWIDAYSKVDGDNWAVLDDTGEIDRDYDLLNSQTLYFSFMDSFDEMTEFEIDTAPNSKRITLTDAVLEFYHNDIEKKYNRFCNIYKKAFEKIPNLDFKGLIKYPYIAQSTSRSGLFSVGILGGDDKDSLFELHISSDDGSNYAVYYFDESGITRESNISGGMDKLLNSFNNKKVEITSFTDEIFNDAYDKLSEAIKNAGFKLGESLTEAKNDTLNPAIWENNELRPEVKEKLELIVDKFKERLKEDGVDIDVDDVLIVGSNANYNYTDKSDIDLHLIADLSIYKDKEDLAQVVYNAYRRLFNDKFDPMIYGHEVELYIEPKE